jgi:hypothetical protein
MSSKRDAAGGNPWGVRVKAAGRGSSDRWWGGWACVARHFCFPSGTEYHQHWTIPPHCLTWPPAGQGREELNHSDRDSAFQGRIALVPKLRLGNAYREAPASHRDGAGSRASRRAFPSRSLGTRDSLPFREGPPRSSIIFCRLARTFPVAPDPENAEGARWPCVPRAMGQKPALTGSDRGAIRPRSEGSERWQARTRAPPQGAYATRTKTPRQRGWG